ncbi:hypothetical protein HDA32_000878 [Spinactinospora alkalitolerans]|uniref:MobA-like NTP transferase domain-containing protein n=1 Tax=Spinactinospora alkalitolerans TaxID=687207 RepID=A0A852TP80_9ACTN|nr:hypothetical protein [Spinactinospora alkalitolerans]NYE45758.1 hypothetical protein [Spinactinospora alkalitolerans]
MKRIAAVLATPGTGSAPPPGVDPAEFALALTEDTYEVVAGLELCEPAVVVWGADDDAELARRAAGVAELTWPGTPVLPVSGAGPVRLALDALAARGADQAALVAADAPDLPPLLVGKLFRALGSAEVAVCPSGNGGLVALAARLPTPDWPGDVGLDDPEALALLAEAAPARRALSTAPGWHRLRTPADIARLDPGLEGWDSTRVLLAGR